jgi:hypothetical protein
MKGLIYLIEQSQIYWPILTAGAVILSGLLAFLLKWQALREAPLKKRKLLYEVQKAEQEKKEMELKLLHEKSGFIFENIRISTRNRYWRRATQDKFDYFTLNDKVRHATPSFDVVVRNNSRSTITIWAVGVHIIQVATYSYSMAGVAGTIPEAQPLDTSAAYAINMPNMWERTKHLFFDEVDPPLDVDEILKKECDPPYNIPSEGQFRYELALRNYSNMLNHTVLRFWILTSDGPKESQDFGIHYGYATGWTTGWPVAGTEERRRAWFGDHNKKS